MSRAATKAGTKRSKAMQLGQLQRAARRQFPDVTGHILAAQVRKLAKLADAGRLHIGPRQP